VCTTGKEDRADEGRAIGPWVLGPGRAEPEGVAGLCSSHSDGFAMLRCSFPSTAKEKMGGMGIGGGSKGGCRGADWGDC